MDKTFNSFLYDAIKSIVLQKQINQKLSLQKCCFFICYFYLKYKDVHFEGKEHGELVRKEILIAGKKALDSAKAQALTKIHIATAMTLFSEQAVNVTEMSLKARFVTIPPEFENDIEDIKRMALLSISPMAKELEHWLANAQVHDEIPEELVFPAKDYIQHIFDVSARLEDPTLIDE